MLTTMITIKTDDLIRRTGEVAKAILNGEKVTIARPKNQNWVIVSETKFNEIERKARNAEYIAKLDQGQEDIKNGNLVTMSMDELRAIEESL